MKCLYLATRRSDQSMQALLILFDLRHLDARHISCTLIVPQQKKREINAVINLTFDLCMFEMQSGGGTLDADGEKKTRCDVIGDALRHIAIHTTNIIWAHVCQTPTPPEKKACTPTNAHSLGS